MRSRDLLIGVCGTLFLGLGVATALRASEAASDAALGRHVDNFSLSDFRGANHALADYADKQAVVLAFVGVECPLAKLYAPRLAELAAEYEPRGVAFLAIDANRQDAVTELAAYARQHGIKFPVLKDLQNSLADRLGAEQTPEVFVLDRARNVCYHGRIDDQYGLANGSGYARPKLTRRDLAEALDELLAGKPIRVASTLATGCLIGRIREPKADSPVTYSNQIARILQKQCVECHRPGEIGPFALLTYDEVVGWAEMIDEVVQDQRMPPWHANPEFGHFANDRRMSEEDRELIHTWVKNGAPEGNPSDLPAPRKFVEGWGIPEPDMVVYMDDEPYKLPAEGTIDYQYFTVDPGFKEDKWIKASECKPGNRSVVHHIFFFVQPPGAIGQEELNEQTRRDKRRDPAAGPDFTSGPNSVRLISGTAPGVPPFVSPNGMAFYVPAGSKFIFQMHYTPNGVATEDRSYVGLVFADPAEVKSAVNMGMAINPTFEIPAHADNHPVESNHKFNRDSLILSLTPHMHLRGKAFRYELTYPDGRKEVLLDVPRYDFNWQITYELAKPLHVPAGSKLHCVAHFDNSDHNLANPDPDHAVRWGDQTWEEMMIGWFAETTDLDIDALAPDETRTAAFVRSAEAGQVEVSQRIEKQAAKALGSDKAFDILHRLVTTLVPQVDRTCVSQASEGVIHFRALTQTPLLKAKLGGKETEISGEGLALAQYATGTEPVVVNDYAHVTATDLMAMSRGVRSSLHVPIKVNGQPACVNFWSREPNAFPPQAVDALVKIAKLMESGAN